MRTNNKYNCDGNSDDDDDGGDNGDGRIMYP